MFSRASEYAVTRFGEKIEFECMVLEYITELNENRRSRRNLRPGRKPWIWDHAILLETDSIIHPVERRIFRSVRAAIVYDRSEIYGSELSSVENLYRPINVELLSVEDLAKVSADDFDVLGVIGQRALEGSSLFLEAFTCLKIGFYSAAERPEHSLGSMGFLKACHKLPWIENTSGFFANHHVPFLRKSHSPQSLEYRPRGCGKYRQGDRHLVQRVRQLLRGCNQSPSASMLFCA